MTTPTTQIVLQDLPAGSFGAGSPADPALSRVLALVHACEVLSTTSMYHGTASRFFVDDAEAVVAAFRELADCSSGDALIAFAEDRSA